MVVGSIPTVGDIHSNAVLAEWSKALRSGRNLFGGVGSNPTGCNSVVPFPFPPHGAFAKGSQLLTHRSPVQARVGAQWCGGSALVRRS